MNKDAQKLDQLKDLLLVEDRSTVAELQEKINYLESVLNEKEKLSQIVNPIIDKKLDTFSDDIPQKLGPTITATLQKQIAESQDQVIEVLYPIIGKLIKKYISQEIKILSDKINDQVQKTFSLSNFKRRITAFFTGVSHNDLVLSELSKPTIEQVFVIEKGSGIMLASSTYGNNVDKDLVAGMLTAIKSFVEDAFVKEEQSLELIQYELFNIHIQNLSSYYVAVVISGSFNNKFKSELENDIFDFAKKNLTNNVKSESITLALDKIIKNDKAN